MAEYFSLDAIAARLGLGSRFTVVWWIDHFGFPAFKRRRPGAIKTNVDVRRVWYTNDEMILAWQLARANQERQERLARKEERARTRSRLAAEATVNARSVRSSTDGGSAPVL